MTKYRFQKIFEMVTFKIEGKSTAYHRENGHHYQVDDLETIVDFIAKHSVKQ